MRFRPARLLALAFLTSVAGAAFGAPGAQEKAGWGPPTTAFVGDMVFRNGQRQERKAQLYYTPDRQRLEYVAGREPVALIVDEQAGKSWLLLLNRRQYRVVPHQPVDFFLGVSNPSSKRRVVGEETILGRRATKMEVTAKTRTGDRFEGFAWATDERIVLKLSGTVTRGEKRQKIEMTMTRLEIGPVEPALLSVPRNYEALPPGRRRQ